MKIRPFEYAEMGKRGMSVRGKGYGFRNGISEDLFAYAENDDTVKWTVSESRPMPLSIGMISLARSETQYNRFVFSVQLGIKEVAVLPKNQLESIKSMRFATKDDRATK